MEGITGMPAEEVIGRRPQDIFPLVWSPEISKLVDRALDGETVRSPDTQYEIPQTGRMGCRVATFAPHRDATGAIVGVIGVINDISSRKAAEEALSESEQRYREIFGNANDIIFTHDLAGNFTSVNKAGEVVSGYERGDVMKMNISQIVAPDDLEIAISMLRQKLVDSAPPRYELTIVSRDGKRVPLEVNSRLVTRDGNPVGIQGIARDITEQKRAEEQLERLALFDSVTDLPNRVLLHDRLAQGILTAGREGGELALLVMELDRFKDVNDTFGHHYGDALLKQVGPRLQKMLRESDTIARLGGDEFALVLLGTDACGAVATAQKILGALSRPFFVDGQSLDVNASIGIALFPSHGEDNTTLLRQADVAMYVAKRNHVGFSLYSAKTEDFIFAAHRLRDVSRNGSRRSPLRE
jgi:diguanylate cyclase (GGDEF)-like protein/PAS domain S-box-containing protein